MPRTLTHLLAICMAMGFMGLFLGSSVGCESEQRVVKRGRFYSTQDYGAFRDQGGRSLRRADPLY